jgi:predicted nicotinamide N-methyase
MVSVSVVEAVVSVGELELAVLLPRDSEALLDEHAFQRDEFLPYWAELWPSGVALASAVGTRPLDGHRVVELGCGLALPSIAAARAGARVLATDWSPAAVALAASNARRNGVRLSTAICDWNAPSQILEGAPWDLVLAADVLYERRDVAPLLELLPKLVTDGGEVLIADPGRPGAKEFFARAANDWTVSTLFGATGAGATVYRLTPAGC